jgi:hypothetical protein
MAQQARTDWQGAQTSTSGQAVSGNMTRDEVRETILGKLGGNVPPGINIEDLVNKAVDAGALNQPSQQAKNVFTQDAAQVQQANAQQQNAMAQQQELIKALQAQGGIQNQSQVYNQGQALAGQLQNMANGQGPSVAQAMLANSTGQNVANQAALMAGQRGAGANVGMMARQAGQQGGAMQQQAAGQSALLRNQEQMNAIGALQQQQGMLGNLAGQQVNNYQQAQGMGNQQAAQNQSTQLQALQNQNALISGNTNAITGINAGADRANAEATNKMIGDVVGGVLTGGASVLAGGLSKKAHGGEITAYKGKSKLGARFAQGGMVPALVSPGEIYLTPEQAKLVAQDKMSPMAGERIPGQARVPGDSEKNDIVAKMLEAGGVVIKRTKAQDPEAAKKFVKAVKGRK